MKSSIAFALCKISFGISDFPVSVSLSNIPLWFVPKESKANSIALARISCSSVIAILSEDLDEA